MVGASVERKRDDSGGFDLNIWKCGREDQEFRCGHSQLRISVRCNVSNVKEAVRQVWGLG